ncbi:ATP-binding cassette domain-containing protein [Bifidobacterium amazonense]|uniref:ATP-binding cassette domain-containing protein n=1 Tax=Bifidobacterium amazonense TaxID=2809027 RepID=A0ABS9VXV1_9BIFI|nr:ATP-binding cassette domain-containing protein [Bifidobacterium amazonense]MCH9276948.1 ATP-binding cassette domain-containing protein [Bifidobacterium amazonense]
MSLDDLIETWELGWDYAPIADGGRPIPGLDGVSVHIRAGEFVGVVGPTGAGKSTLCMALAGIIPNLADGDMRGTVTVTGHDTSRTSVAELSLNVGYVQQDPESQLFCASVEDEIAFPLENRGMDPALMDRRIDETLALVGMGEYRKRVPTSLSGGQMQRVALAAALAAEPDILILDEPTAALDPDGKRDVFAALAAIRRSRAGRDLTVVMAEQDTSHFPGWADRILVLDRGRLVAQGDAGLFDREPELFTRLGVALPGDGEPTLHVLPTDDGKSTDDPAIALDHVTYRYAGSTDDNGRGGTVAPALDDVTCTIPRGAFVGLIGRNGSGKTTLARHLNALLKPASGRVVVDGLDARTHTVGRMAAHVGFVFQNPDHQIFCASTREEIGFGPRALGRTDTQVRAAVDDMLRLFDLERVADVSPATLGYGDRRIVALASVLAMRTPILVLDEPTAGLDRRLSATLLDAVAALNRAGTTVIMISHDMRAVAHYCTHVMRMDAGRLVEYGRLVRGDGRRDDGHDSHDDHAAYDVPATHNNPETHGGLERHDERNEQRKERR